jgi:hypothetical protein
VSDPAHEADKRTKRLRESVSGIRTRGSSKSVGRWLMIAGAASIGIGLPLILLGWWGAARTPYVFEQVPYLISGGLFGLALAVVGGLFYFAYWLTRQVQETRRQADETRAAIGRIGDLLASGAMSAAAGGHPSGRSKSAGNGSFVATEKGTMFHRPDCPVVAGRSDVRHVSADTKGLEPCKMCDPLGVATA